MDSRLTADLPFSKEILLSIYSYLDIKSLLRVIQLNKHHQKIASSPFLFEFFLKRDFLIELEKNSISRSKEIYSDFYKERKKFIRFVTATHLMQIDIERREKIGEFSVISVENDAKNQTHSPFEVEFIQKIESEKIKNKILSSEAKKMYQLFLTLPVSEFYQYLNELAEKNSISKKQWNKISRAAEDFFSLLKTDAIKEAFMDEDDDASFNLEQEEGITEENRDIFEQGFDFLCQIDAPLSVDLFLKQVPKRDQPFILQTLFSYPSLNVIKKALDVGIDINIYFDIPNGLSLATVTPLMIVILQICDGAYLEQYAKIISFLLDNGADIDANINCASFDITQLSIYEACEHLLKQQPEAITASNSDVFHQIMNTIIQFKKTSHRFF